MEIDPRKHDKPVWAGGETFADFQRRLKRWHYRNKLPRPTWADMVAAPVENLGALEAKRAWIAEHADELPSREEDAE